MACNSRYAETDKATSSGWAAAIASIACSASLSPVSNCGQTSAPCISGSTSGAGSQTMIGVGRPDRTIRPIGRSTPVSTRLRTSSLTRALLFRYLLAPSSPGGGIHRIAERGVADAAFAAEIADDRLAVMQADAGAADHRPVEVAVAELTGEIQHFQGRREGIPAVIGPGDRCAPEGDDRVADELVDGAAVVEDDVAHAVEIGVEERGGLLRRDDMAEAGESLDIGEQGVDRQRSPRSGSLDGSLRIWAAISRGRYLPSADWAKRFWSEPIAFTVASVAM